METRTVDLGKVVGPAGPNEVSSSTDTAFNGVLVGNGSKVGAKSMDTTGLTDDNDHVPTSGVVKSALADKANAESLAIVANGNTHIAITAGQYVYVKNHSTLAEGLYKATDNISANATLSTNNLTPDSKGGLNDILVVEKAYVSDMFTRASGVTLAGDPYNNTNQYNYLLKQNNVIQLRFDVINVPTASNAYGAIGTLAAKYCPNSNVYGVLVSDGVARQFRIKPNGGVEIFNPVAGKEYVITLLYLIQ